MIWTATFDAEGNVTLTPDTPETRRDLAETWTWMHSGKAGIERAEIVRALSDRYPNEEWNDFDREDFVAQARAAITALSNPTDEMLKAGCLALEAAAAELMAAQLSNQPHAIGRTKMRLRWRACLGAALTTGEQTP